MTISIIQIIVTALIITLILLQERSAGISGLLGGGGDSGGVYQTRRGMEKAIFWGTIVLLVVFVGLAVYQITL